MSWLLLGVAVIAAAIVILLAIPVRLSVRVEQTDHTRAEWRLRWLFGAVDVRLGGRQSRDGLETPEEPDQPKTPKSTRRPRRRRGSVLAVLRTPGFVQRVFRLVPDLIGRLRWEHVSLDATFGFEDPADTGQLYGALSPILVASRAQGWPIVCRPAFDRAGLEGTCAAAVRVRPLAVVWVAVRFALSLEVWRAVRAWRRSG